MRKILLTSVGVAALAVSANATDFTLSGTAKVKVADDGNTSVDVSTAIGVSKTFDNGMVLSLSNNNMSNAGELTVKSDAISVTFGDYDQNEKNPGLNGNAASADISGDGITATSHSNDGAISLGATVAGLGVGAAMNNDGDTMFGASFTTDFKNHQFYAGFPTTGLGPNILLFSEPNDDDAFTNSGGSGNINVGFNITGLAKFRDALYVFGKTKIKKLTGWNIEDLEL